jgi:hypothetical protein
LKRVLLNPWFYFILTTVLLINCIVFVGNPLITGLLLGITHILGDNAKFLAEKNLNASWEKK